MTATSVMSRGGYSPRFQANATPNMFKCAIDGQWHDPSKFSSNQLSKWHKKKRFTNDGITPENVGLICRYHTTMTQNGQNPSRLIRCHGPCGAKLGIESFSKTQRNESDARCITCTFYTSNFDIPSVPYGPCWASDNELEVENMLAQMSIDQTGPPQIGAASYDQTSQSDIFAQPAQTGIVAEASQTGAVAQTSQSDIVTLAAQTGMIAQGPAFESEGESEGTTQTGVGSGEDSRLQQYDDDDMEFTDGDDMEVIDGYNMEVTDDYNMEVTDGDDVEVTDGYNMEVTDGDDREVIDGDRFDAGHDIWTSASNGGRMVRQGSYGYGAICGEDLMREDDEDEDPTRNGSESVNNIDDMLRLEISKFTELAEFEGGDGYATDDEETSTEEAFEAAATEATATEAAATEAATTQVGSNVGSNVGSGFGSSPQSSSEDQSSDSASGSGSMATKLPQEQNLTVPFEETKFFKPDTRRVFYLPPPQALQLAELTQNTPNIDPTNDPNASSSIGSGH